MVEIIIDADNSIDLEDLTKPKNDVYRFTLPEDFIDQYRDKQPDWGPLGYFTYKRTYARYIEEEDRTEEFFETVRRVVEGIFTIQKKHCLSNGYVWDEEKAKKSSKEMFRRIWEMKFLPPGRGLWTMGTKFIEEKGGAAANNCAFVSTENIAVEGSKPFRWAMDMLMLGVGVGFDTKGKGSFIVKNPHESYDTFVIPDSREGWVIALGLVIDPFVFEPSKLEEIYRMRKLSDPLYKDVPIFNGIPKFDFSKIRKRGEPIRGFGGKASGPKPLMELLDNVYHILSERVGEPIRSIDIIDIYNNIAKCVIAGNVRRSAEISLGDPDDFDFIDAKLPSVMKTTPQWRSARWASNNTLVIREGEKVDYDLIASRIAANGEPGLLFIDNARKYSRMGDPPDNKDYRVAGTNPCGEQSLESYEMCCLVEVFPNKHDSFEDFRKTLKMAYMYAKTVTLLKTHWAETNNVMHRNRRIGVSLSGLMNAHARLGRKTVLEWARKGYEYLRELDRRYSEDWLIVNKSIKITTIKPSGTVSLLPGESPGIHYPHSEYYIRRIRVDADSPLLPILEEAGYNIYPEPTSAIYKYGGNGKPITENGKKVVDYYTTMIVEFPVHEKHFTYGKEDVSMWKQLANVIDYQKYWSDNQVSVTITFKREEAEELPDLIEFASDKVKSLSFLPILNHGYENPPYEAITREKYIEMTRKLKPLDFRKIKKDGIGEKYCTADGKCEVTYN